MKIGIIGSGRVGCSIGKFFMNHNTSVVGYYDQVEESAIEAAEFTGTDSFQSMEELVLLSDTLFITTPDGIIGDVWDLIRGMSISNKIVCHCSGSLSSVVFSGIETTGAYACSIHPMLAFSDRFTSYEQLNNAFLSVEGDEYAVRTIRDLFEAFGNTIYEIGKDKKALYHAAASVISNQVVAVLDMGYEMLASCGFSKDDAIKATNKLVMGNVQNVISKGTVAALTGPIDRNDVETVRKHLMAIDKEDVELYVALARRLLRLAREKNPKKDYDDMRRLLYEEYSGNI